MDKYGLAYEIPNEYGSHLEHILIPLEAEKYHWSIEFSEIHLLKACEFSGNFLFSENYIEGTELLRRATNNKYYMIFATLRGYLGSDCGKKYKTYDGFLESNDELFVSVVDCSYVMICSKSSRIIERAYNYAYDKKYENLRVLSEKDLIKYHLD